MVVKFGAVRVVPLKVSVVESVRAVPAELVYGIAFAVNAAGVSVRARYVVAPLAPVVRGVHDVPLYSSI